MCVCAYACNYVRLCVFVCVCVLCALAIVSGPSGKGQHLGGQRRTSVVLSICMSCWMCMVLWV